MTGPKMFGLPPGVDFAEALVAGLAERHAADPPEDWARMRLYVATGRMARRVREVFDAGPPRLLPRIVSVADLDDGSAGPGIPPARARLPTQLDLAELLGALIDRHPGLAPLHAIPGLATSLADLLDEMAGAGVAAAALAGLDVADHADHWAQSRRIVEAAMPWLDRVAGGTLPPEGRRRRIVERLAERWRVSPPAHPVIVAGSTGSRAATHRLMAAVAGLPRGAVVLPGFDAGMPEAHWQALARDAADAGGEGGGADGAEDHPQFRFLALLRTLGATPGDVRPWTDAAPPDPPRNALISLALCPAPVTDRWRAEGAALGDPRVATAGLSLLEAASPRLEALAIALRLRRAVEDGQRAALITPDRDLARRVAAALDRWEIEPDDSGGTPLHHSPPGRLLRLTAGLMRGAGPLTDLLALLKHPLTATGSERGPHLRATREFELWARQHRVPRPSGADLARFAAKRPAHAGWAEWVGGLLDRAAGASAPMPLPDRIAAHLELTETVAAGPGASGPGAGALWDQAAGREARRAMDALAQAASGRPAAMDARAYGDLLLEHLRAHAVQDPRRPHPGVMIWGTLEARAGGADLAILGGLNEGTWPASPAPDPWLNRRMRAEIGLPLPERQTGLAAHDFQQAACAPEVMLSRARRDAEAETVPARWLNRLTNLLKGQGPDGEAALDAMRARGSDWARMAEALDRPAARARPAPRPSPQPPAAARPRALSVTQVTTLLRDPYAIYAGKVLRLKRLNPRLATPDARMRGEALHAVMAAFLDARSGWQGDAEAARAALLGAAAREIPKHAPDTAVALLWQSRIAAIADRIVAGETDRLADAVPVLIEEKGHLEMAEVGFTLIGKADRIDRRGDGGLLVYDYKSGTPPSKKQREHFDRQLPLEAAMAEAGAFPALAAGPVVGMGYVSLSRSGRDEPVAVTDDQGRAMPARARADLAALIRAYDTVARGYTARRAAEKTRFEGDFDHLARYGEWDLTDDAVAIPVGVAPGEAG